MKRCSEPDQARKIIEMACRVLSRYRRQPTRFGVGRSELEMDCYVLLEDASRWFCAALSEEQGEPLTDGVSRTLPRTLFEHPEVCEDILVRLETAHRPRQLELNAVSGW